MYMYMYSYVLLQSFNSDSAHEYIRPTQSYQKATLPYIVVVYWRILRRCFTDTLSSMFAVRWRLKVMCLWLPKPKRFTTLPCEIAEWCQFLADRSDAHNVIGYWHNIVVCLSVRLSICDQVYCVVCVSTTHPTAEVWTSAPYRNTIYFTIFNALHSPYVVKPHILNHKRWCHVANTLKTL